ncbi:MAG: GNAT family N-acetyltransferase [Desulfovibrionaceae bacterium]|nr:GNAT family N-acetyltransferase [Desulfovibrionaceae bacterium]
MVRPYCADDLPRLLELWLQGSLNAHPFIPAEHWKAMSRDMQTGFLELCDILVYTDEYPDSPEAFLSIIDGFIAGLFVSKSHQCQGIGSRLLRIAKRMHEHLELTVYQKNTGAVRFYQKNGFRIAGTRIEKATGEIEYIMIF